MVRPEPIPHVRRQQKPLLTPTLNEVLRHRNCVKQPRRNDFMKQPRRDSTLRLGDRGAAALVWRSGSRAGRGGEEPDGFRRPRRLPRRRQGVESERPVGRGRAARRTARRRLAASSSQVTSSTARTSPRLRCFCASGLVRLVGGAQCSRCMRLQVTAAAAMAYPAPVRRARYWPRAAAVPDPASVPRARYSPQAAALAVSGIRDLPEWSSCGVRAWVSRYRPFASARRKLSCSAVSSRERVRLLRCSRRLSRTPARRPGAAVRFRRRPRGVRRRRHGPPAGPVCRRCRSPR